MKIVIIAQEDPIAFSPFFRSIVEKIPEEVCLIAIAGNRGAGSHPKSFTERIRYLYLLWRLMEPAGFIRNLTIKIWYRLIQILHLTGTVFDQRTLKGAAKKHGISLINISNANDPATIEHIKTVEPDIIINQSELLLKDDIIAVPRIGIINRHASRLPRFRGRLASFWSHAAQPPDHAVTIHFVDKGIDTGSIIHQESLDIPDTASFTQVLDIVFKESPNILLQALDKLRSPDFEPMVNNHKDTPLHPFPTLEDVQEYRKVLHARRTDKK